MKPSDPELSNDSPPDQADLAADLFLGRRSGELTDAEQARLHASLADPAGVSAVRNIERAWAAVGNHASAPELMVLREQALVRARQANVRRWRLPMRRSGKLRQLWQVAAAIAGVTVAAVVAWQLSPNAFVAGVYQTALGEHRVIELDDHSRIELDTRTRVQVRFSEDARIVEITEGQAQFSVAKDPARPFTVIAGDQAIIALGTIFTVEYIDREMKIAMVEGRVAIVPQSPVAGTPQSLAESSPPNIELSAGEELRVHKDGRTTLKPKADLEAATAWRQGRVIFYVEPLAEAVRRLNRYSRVQIEVGSPDLAKLSISGVFEAGDTRAFAEALQSYLPVKADFSDKDTIKLTMK